MFCMNKTSAPWPNHFLTVTVERHSSIANLSMLASTEINLRSFQERKCSSKSQLGWILWVRISRAVEITVSSCMGYYADMVTVATASEAVELLSVLWRKTCQSVALQLHATEGCNIMDREQTAVFTFWIFRT
jgi:hypothetical protein